MCNLSLLKAFVLPAAPAGGSAAAQGDGGSNTATFC